MSDDKVTQWVTVARNAGLSHSLTEKQWRVTLKHFNHRCAYCQRTYEMLEHVVPLKQGGGTTQTNCVPSCASCNTCKDHPKFLLGGSNQKAVERLLRIKSYFQSLHDDNFDKALLDNYIEVQRTKIPRHHNQKIAQ